MEYVCYVDTSTSDVPGLDMIDVESVEAAEAHCRKLLAERGHAVAVHLYRGDTLIRTLRLG